jgi:hypothetical protein
VLLSGGENGSEATVMLVTLVPTIHVLVVYCGSVLVNCEAGSGAVASDEQQNVSSWLPK